MTANIGLFDSGVGGLSVLAALRTRLPGARFAYCADTRHFPYGVRSEADVAQIVRQEAGRFVAKAALDLLVIACNTASTAALPPLRAALKIPVVGVVPAVKPAARATKTGTIGLLATPGTVQRPYIDDLIRDHAAGCRVVRAGSSRLVELAEAKLRGEPVDAAAVRAELAPLFAASPPADNDRLDVVVLGCTHFPLLLDELTQAAPWPVRWLDSSEAIAARAAFLLLEAGVDATTPAPGPIAPPFYVTGEVQAAHGLAGTLADLGLHGPQPL